MKTTPLVALACVFLLLAGCARIPLSVESHADELTPSLGVNAEDVRFLSNALFAQVELGENETYSVTSGFAAMSGKELILAKGGPGSHKTKIIQRIPFADLEAVARVYPQLQLIYQDFRIVLYLFQKSRMTPDIGNWNELAERLELESVPAVDGVFIARVGQRRAPTTVTIGGPSSADSDFGSSMDSHFYGANGVPRDYLPVPVN